MATQTRSARMYGLFSDVTGLTPGGLGGRLPTAHACFNKLDLPEYATHEVLRAKLQLAIAGARGFDEAAVAV